MPHPALSALSLALLLVTLAGCASLNSTDPNQATYRSARRALEESRNDDAAAKYAAVTSTGGVYTEAALLDGGYAALRRGDAVAAKAIADRYIALYPQSTKLSYAVVLQATAQYAVLRDSTKPTNAELDAAIAQLNHVKDAYPAAAPADVVDEMVRDLQARRK